jgi:CheY-like chemotaxis protein
MLEFVDHRLVPDIGNPARRHLPLFAPDGRSAGAAVKPPARILVVEDEYLVAMLAEAALLDAGFVVVGIAQSADEAIGMAMAHSPDLVIMDIRLAGEGDGIDAAMHLAQHDVPCVFATAHTDPATRTRGDAAAPLAWVSKPYTAADLVTATRSALAQVETGRRR